MTLLFLKQFLLRPAGMGAVVPSSRLLARRMVDALDPQAGEHIVELGPGTGVFTRELLARGVAPSLITLVEFNKALAAHLRKAFPALRVIEGDAEDLPRLLAGLPAPRKIISGIPLRSMPPAKVARIARAVASVLPPGGRLVQFSYFSAPSIAPAVAKEAGLAGRRAGMTLINMPPAFVWRYTKSH